MIHDKPPFGRDHYFGRICSYTFIDVYYMYLADFIRTLVAYSALFAFRIGERSQTAQRGWNPRFRLFVALDGHIFCRNVRGEDYELK